MEILEGIATRRSIRGFKPTPVPRDVIEKIMQAASQSPSYTNTQPWEVVVVSGGKRDDLARKLSELAKGKAAPHPDLPTPKTWPQALGDRARDHGARRLSALGIARDDEEGRERMRLGNFEFYGAPCAVFLFMDGSLGDWSVFDMGLFAENLILAAHSFGVETCLQASITGYAAEIKGMLGIAESKKLVIGISMGYPDETAKLNSYRALRLKPEEFTRWCD